jgi:glycogen phosphorylase
MNEPKPDRGMSRDKSGLLSIDVGKCATESDIVETKSAILAKLALAVGKDPAAATDRDWFVAAALTVRDRVVHRWFTSERVTRGNGRKRVYFLSLEFLIG